ncbi:3-mercaptopyruvate sulfurtransferase [Hyphococcus sp.]|uniref:3-mercaptopyruvate sulfurtransferase n=1 Tax=Hyphococcus sp. TaxID=2038636 RepID=UPI0035C737C7
MTFGPLVSTQWLADHLGEKDVKIVDGSWRMPGQGAAIDNYNEQHIPGAVFFDIDAIADRQTDLPHMLPAPAQFATAMEALGIADTDRVVVYDEKGLFSAARVWWTFRMMGHEKVAVLDGGLPRWLAENRPVTAEKTIPVQTTYTPRPQPALAADADAVRAALSGGDTVLDARSAERFAGAAPDPRPGVRSGHMPGAKNLPFSNLLDGDALKPAETLAAIFTDAGIAPESRVITSCGSGVTAAVLSLALEVIGSRAHALYDGSWSEWGKETHDNDLFPVVADVEE